MYDIHYQHAAMKIRPSLTLLLAILQLALTHLQSGVAPYEITSWAANGLLPHALNGYELLPTGIKEEIQTIKNIFARSFVPPAKVVADMADMLATACNWFDDGLAISRGQTGPKRRLSSNAGGGSGRTGQLDTMHPVHCRTYYNVPLMAARMVRALGLQQQVLDNALALMGGSEAAKASIKEEGGSEKNDEASESQKFAIPALKCAALGNLYTPLDVASVIIVACKCCPGWENWRISTRSCEGVTDPDQLTSFVPWNEQHLCLLENGPSVDHYLNFLQSSGFVRGDQKCKMYWQSLEKNLSDPDMDLGDPNTDTAVLNSSNVLSVVEGNRVLSGAPNPNEELDAGSKNDGQEQEPFLYKRYQQSSKKPPDANYARLVEFICYVIQEPRPIELHKSVERIEDELANFFHRRKDSLLVVHHRSNHSR